MLSPQTDWRRSCLSSLANGQVAANATWRRRALALGGCAVLSSVLAGVSTVKAEAPVAVDARAMKPMRFDIPAQPLASALDAYARAAGVSVLFDGQLAADQRSAPIQGNLAPAVALQRLLAGTHLAVSFTSPTAFTLVASGFALVEGVAPPSEEKGEVKPVPDHEARVVQATLEDTLCQLPDTRPGSYRAVVQLWLNPQGGVRQVRLLQSTGIARRDAALEAAMKTMVMDSLRSESDQPYTVLVQPQTGKNTEICSHAVATAF